MQENARGTVMKTSFATIAATILCVSIATITFAHLFFVRNSIKRQDSADTYLAAHIRNTLVSKLAEPLVVSRSLARDEFLIDFLKNESELKNDEETMKSYLSRIKNEFDYAQMTLVSGATRRYYRDDGVHKIVNPENDAHDTWFANFSNGSVRQFSEVYVAKDSESSTMYFNVRVEDSGGAFLGVIAPSLSVSNIISFIRGLEKQYGVKINLVNENGVVKLGSNFEDFGIASLSYLIPTVGRNGEFHRTQYGRGGFAVTNYVEEFGWWFVIRREKAWDGFSRTSFYVFAMFVMIFGLVALFMAHRNGTARKHTFSGNEGEVDSLTGLPNRNFFKDMFGERGVFNTTRYRCLAVFDIDYFKEANDNLNGDEALISVVKNMLRLLNDRGMALRWGGDEFLVLFELPMDSAYAVCRQFVKNVEAERLVTVSVGLTEVRISDTIKKNYYRAAQLCYLVKEMGGNGVKKG